MNNKIAYLILGVVVLGFLVFILMVWGIGGGKLVNCAKEGEVAFNDATGKSRSCCFGLKEVAPKRHAVDGVCSRKNILIGAGSICVNCGNGICEDKETECNCPEDCD